MGLFSFLFSKNKIIRSTHEAETFRELFCEDFEVFCKVEQGDDLKRFQELEEYVNSPLFKKRRRDIEALEYKNSEYYAEEKEYKILLASPKLRAYYLIRDSQELQGYLRVKDTPLYNDYVKLRVVVMSQNFDRKLHAVEYAAYKKIISDPKISALIKLEKNRKFRYYTEMKGTDLPQKFERLCAQIQSEDFKTNRAYLLNKKRYLTTDDYKLLCEHETLKNRRDIQKYHGLLADKYFNGMRRWELVFEDHFKSGRLDENKWITKYYAGERLLNDTYAVGQDVQLFTNDNISFNDSAVCLNFRKESIIGKYWDTTFGIKERKYGYTSAILSSACSFKQRYGRFEAKIKLAHTPVNQCFWIMADMEVPHIDVMKNRMGEVYMGNFYPCRAAKADTTQLLKGFDLLNEYYIFTFEWTKEKMVWMVNDVVVKEEHENIPDTPMFIGFSLGACEEPADKFLPAKMEIDWVRCYRMRDAEAVR